VSHMETVETDHDLIDEIHHLMGEVEKWESKYNELKVYTDTLVNLNQSYWKRIVSLRKKLGDKGGYVEDDE
jgi:hypothetical protein